MVAPCVQAPDPSTTLASLDLLAFLQPCLLSLCTTIASDSSEDVCRQYQQEEKGEYLVRRRNGRRDERACLTAGRQEVPSHGWTEKE